MPIRTAEDFFIDELKDIYSAEKQAIRAYPKLTKAVTSEELKEALETHLEETKGQVERLDRMFEILGKKGTGKTCEGMKGVLEESNEALEVEEGALRDAALIAAAQRAEHYEIAAYGTVAAMAKLMGQEEIAELLNETLEEEKATDQKLTQIAEGVNQEAIGGEEDDEEEEEDESDEEEDSEEEDEEESRAPAKKSAKKAAKSTKK